MRLTPELSRREGHGAQWPVAAKGRRAPDPRLCRKPALGECLAREDPGAESLRGAGGGDRKWLAEGDPGTS